MSIDRLLDHRRLVVCVGPGGVGKTTAAAALALRAASRGRRALVLTIDPARRLADALGLDGLDDEVRRVPAELAAPLDAAMLDTKTSYDALVSRIAGSAEARDRILANRAYQAFSRTMARSHAYVAMERLYDVVESGTYDLVVLDTPPTRSALDILDAPGRLQRFLDERVVQWFLRIPDAEGRIPRGGATVLKMLGTLVGDSIVEELVAFFGVLAHLREGFRDRAARTRAILREPTTAFVLVGTPQPTSLDDARSLRDGLVERGVWIDAVLFNRAFVPEPGSWDVPCALREVPSPERLCPPDDPRYPAAQALFARLAEIRARLARDNERAFASMRAFCSDLPGDPDRIALPRFDADIRDLHGLSTLLAHPTPFA